MKWGKTVLLFQAVITLILGIAFFSQVLTIDISNISDLKASISNPTENQSPQSIIVKERFASAAYILLFVSLMELIIITKLLT